MDCSPPGSFVQGILQARILEWVAMPSSRGSPQPRDQTQLSHIVGGFVNIWATREAQDRKRRTESRFLEGTAGFHLIVWEIFLEAVAPELYTKLGGD